MKLIFSAILIMAVAFPCIGQTSQLSNRTDSVSYCLGVVLGASIKSAGIDNLNNQVFLSAINDVSSGKNLMITAEQANMFLNQYMTMLGEKKVVLNLEESKKFMQENARKEGVVTLPSGLQYKIVKDGEGVSPKDTSFVTVHYTGSLVNGEVFDSSIERGEPAQFPVNGVIPGWTEALQLMKPGSKWILYLPPELAYGERGTRGIEPNSVLIFEVELISVQ
jgi:FKBP-type peptidyl-prolyl cis-trans isomerase FklB